MANFLRLPSVLVVLFLALAACGSSSAPSGSSSPQPTLDIRGTWTEIASVGATQYPQTLQVLTEDLSSGNWTGTTQANSYQVFTVKGTLKGSAINFTSTLGAYVSNAKGKVTLTGNTLTMSGTFKDSNNQSGTYTATRTSIMLP